MAIARTLEPVKSNPIFALTFLRAVYSYTTMRALLCEDGMVSFVAVVLCMASLSFDKTAVSMKMTYIQIVT